jgi:hypothetical protein
METGKDPGTLLKVLKVQGRVSSIKKLARSDFRFQILPACRHAGISDLTNKLLNDFEQKPEGVPTANNQA